MRVAVSSNGSDLDAAVSPVFGRCPTYVFVDTDTLQFEAVPNPAMSAPGGAGIQAAQFVVNQGAQAVITGNVGPNAFNVLASAGVQMYLTPGGTVREAVEALKAGQLQSLSAPSAGMGMGRRMGRGMGRGMGLGRGAYGPSARGTTPPPPPQPVPPASREEEIAALKQTASDLRKQLAQIMERLEKLELGQSPVEGKGG
ncbi:MAG TPA: dinitrogenase iron-molybdenum cofactor biosynthesis protein [Anaerolineae bacterium]|nr:dinitrogenase iron-molybdenum cofactor biosynthesis protein [Anaerolineae bacterium]